MDTGGTTANAGGIGQPGIGGLCIGLQKQCLSVDTRSTVHGRCRAGTNSSQLLQRLFRL